MDPRLATWSGDARGHNRGSSGSLESSCRVCMHPHFGTPGMESQFIRKLWKGQQPRSRCSHRRWNSEGHGLNLKEAVGRKLPRACVQMFRRRKMQTALPRGFREIPDHFMVLGKGCLKALLSSYLHSLFLRKSFISRRTGGFLVVQWLGLHGITATGPSSIPGQKLQFLCSQKKTKSF